MTSSHVVEIEVHDNPYSLASILQRCLDLEQVSIKQIREGAHGFSPLSIESILISTTSLYLLEKFILEPLIEPVAEKLNWVTAIKKHFAPFKPFYLTVKINGGDFIEAPIDDYEITAQIWNLIQKTLDILKSEKRLDKTSKIRFVASKKDNLLIVCYESNRPTRIVKIDSSSTVEIPKEQVVEMDKPYTINDFDKALAERHEEEAHRKYVESQKKTTLEGIAEAATKRREEAHRKYVEGQKKNPK